MERIRDISVGETVVLVLLVKSADTRYTKPPGNKPYLVMELFDGYDTISANNWDYGDTAPPARNTVLRVKAAVTEWAGNKQLNIKGQVLDEDHTVANFAPKGNFDINEYIGIAKQLISEIKNEHVRCIVDKAFKENSALWTTVPSARGVHHAFVAGNLKHSVDVALKAKALGEIDGVNIDLCIAGGLLQDFGKLWTYSLDGAVIDMTYEGQLFEHISVGMMKLEGYRTPENSKVLDFILHMVASHHSKLEYGSPMTPKFAEAWIVAYADGQDAKAQVIRELNAKLPEGAMYTAKEWTLENRQMISQEYIEQIMNS